jgi:mRNA interferase MazF
MALEIKRFDVYAINFNPVAGSEIQRTKLCLIISPDEMNRHIRTVIVAPMTSAGKDCPTRVTCTFRKRRGQIVLDQIRTMDKSRLIKKLGTIDSKSRIEVISILQRMFAF